VSPALFFGLITAAGAACFALLAAARSRADKSQIDAERTAFADSRGLDYDGAIIYGDVDGIALRIEFLRLLVDDDRTIPFTRVRARAPVPLELRAWAFKEREVLECFATDVRGKVLALGVRKLIASDEALAQTLFTSMLRRAVDETTFDALFIYERGEVTLLWLRWERDAGVLDRALAVIRALHRGGRVSVVAPPSSRALATEGARAGEPSLALASSPRGQDGRAPPPGRPGRRRSMAVATHKSHAAVRRGRSLAGGAPRSCVTWPILGRDDPRGSSSGVLRRSEQREGGADQRVDGAR
jgi:hypothetical protein